MCGKIKAMRSACCEWRRIYGVPIGKERWEHGPGAETKKDSREASPFRASVFSLGEVRGGCKGNQAVSSTEVMGVVLADDRFEQGLKPAAPYGVSGMIQQLAEKAGRWMKKHPSE